MTFNYAASSKLISSPGNHRKERFTTERQWGRGCHDAIGSLFNTLRGKGKRVWILDADLAGAFDKIDHEHLLKAIGGCPARGMIAGWLRAGISEAGKGY